MCLETVAFHHCIADANAIVKRRCIPLRYVDVPEQWPIPPPQLMLRQHPGSDCFAADQHPAHAPIVAVRTDTLAEIDTSAEKLE